ncbi:MAG: DNA-3-methyladenine glycosylase [Pseudomonadales bacterium]|nr:DNA-3-methyladenine glycosylase [Pseudomonadales bacterium]
MIAAEFFDQEPGALAIALLGKVLRHRYHHPDRGPKWLSARILETEAYYLTEHGSHSSQGFTESRKAMFMEPGTLYMYYARGGDSLNFSARGKGNGVLVKSGVPVVDHKSPSESLEVMAELNPVNGRRRPTDKLCSGQTLLCKSLALKVREWNREQLRRGRFVLDDTGYRPARVIQTTRLGIPAGRDDHLPYRFIDEQYAAFCTSNPLTRRSWKEGRDYRVLDQRSEFCIR